MRNLYIIGNGFDIYHGLDTKYQSFASYLHRKDGEIYGYLLIYYGLPDIVYDTVSDEDYEAWSTFEIALADLDYEQVLEDHSDSMANPALEDFRDRDWHTYQIDMELIIKQLTTDLISIFNQFILNVQYPSDINDRRLNLIPQSKYLNFNYTDTLERFYNVDSTDICYIHEKSSVDDCKIVLGHGTDPAVFEIKEPEEPEGLSQDDLIRWKEYMADREDYSLRSAKDEILSYYTKSFKNTLTVIEEKIKFFESLDYIERIYVLGHSISEVDIKYFEAVKNHSPLAVKWYVTYYSDSEKANHMKALLQRKTVLLFYFLRSLNHMHLIA